MEHIRSDVSYPASKQQILAACNNMTMHSPEAKSAAEKLPEQTFQNAGEALKALAAVKLRSSQNFVKSFSLTAGRLNPFIV